MKVSPYRRFTTLLRNFGFCPDGILLRMKDLLSEDFETLLRGPVNFVFSNQLWLPLLKKTITELVGSSSRPALKYPFITDLERSALGGGAAPLMCIYW